MTTRFGSFPGVLLLVPFVAFAASSGRDVRVLSSTGQSIQIEFTPNHYTPKTVVSSAGKEFVDYDFEGSIPLATMRDSGAPDLRCRLLPLAFQSKEHNVVQVIAADYEDIPNVTLKPTPTLESHQGMLAVKDYVVDSRRYAQNKMLPGNVAELSPVEQSRSMFIGGVRVFPVQYNPVTRSLRRYSRIVVEVVFGSSSSPRVQNDDDALFGRLVLNARESRTWKFGKPQSLNRTSGQSSVLASGQWYKIGVSDEGMYVLDAAWLTANGINLSGVDPRTIKIYGNGGQELPEPIASARPVDLVENAIYVEGEADGQFNSSDYILFYGRSVQGIQYDPAGRTLRHYIHHYSRVNYYWLTYGGANGKRMSTQQTVTSSATVIPTKFMDAVWVEPDTVNLVKSGKSWLSYPVNPGGSIVRTFALSGLVLSDPRVYRFTTVSGSSGYSMFYVRESGQLIDSSMFYGVGGDVYGASQTDSVTGTFPLQNNTSQVSFEYRASDASSSGWLDWVEIVYQRTFDPVNNYLRFRSPDTTAVVEYRVGQFSGTSVIFNVTDYANVQIVNATAGTFRAQETRGSVSEYLGCGTTNYRHPASITSVTNQNLRGNSTPYDFIIVTSPEFLSSSNRLRDHRQSAAYGGLRTLVVTVDQIYNEFSSGVPDVTAIRDFLKYAYDNWSTQSPPKFVCFFGQGSYDYKGLLGSKSSYVPTWQRTDSPYDDVYSSGTDDFFIRYDSNMPFMVSGRLNPRSVSEADQLVDRIINYDSRSVRDGWKTRALFVGDDGYVDGVDIEGNIHTEQAEELANIMPDIFEKRKIYEEAYPTVITAQGRRKPGAYQDIIKDINEGVLMVNFTGHGNPTVWTHESVFETATSIPQLTNANKLMYLIAATCNFSQFDDPSRETGSELLMNKPDGGSIGVVSASRKVFSYSNAALNQGIYHYLFYKDSYGRDSLERIATALFLYKASGGSGDPLNDEKYFILGDPTLRLQYPGSFASIDSINNAAVDSAGITGNPLIQLRSLARVTVKGKIRNAGNAIDSTARGQVTLIVNDATESILIPTLSPPWSYSATGSLIYRGQSSVSNGSFTASFVVPKDIAYADSTTRGRVVAYFTSSSGTNDGIGYTSNVSVSGSNPAAARDTSGPSMKIMVGASYDAGQSFHPGDVVNQNAVLFVDLSDSSGINTSTSGVGHRIEAWFNGSSQSKDMTNYYTSKLDDFKSGTVQYPVGDLPQGKNIVKVRAWDTYNNSSTSETYFEVMTSDQLRVVDVLNYPNPFTRSTAFTFRHNQSVPVNATVKIYTVAGRLIQTLDKYGTGDTFVSIPWDGRDRDGDALANGVYLYKLIVRTSDGRYSSEVLGKLAIAK